MPQSINLIATILTFAFMQGTILLSEQREEEKEENFTLFRETFL
jgi:hypothetical protein